MQFGPPSPRRSGRGVRSACGREPRPTEGTAEAEIFGFRNSSPRGESFTAATALASNRARNNNKSAGLFYTKRSRGGRETSLRRRRAVTGNSCAGRRPKSVVPSKGSRGFSRGTSCATNDLNSPSVDCGAEKKSSSEPLLHMCVVKLRERWGRGGPNAERGVRRAPTPACRPGGWRPAGPGPPRSPADGSATRPGSDPGADSSPRVDERRFL